VEINNTENKVMQRLATGSNTVPCIPNATGLKEIATRDGVW
jgi:hypothetical protein